MNHPFPSTAQARRRLIGLLGGSAALAVLPPPALAQSAGATLSIGLLRAPAAAIVDLTERRGWFKEAGVQLNSVLFASAAGPKIIQALGGGAIGISFVNTTAAVLGAAGGAIPLRYISIATDASRLLSVLSSSEIDSVPKLAGKRVACTAGTGLHYFFGRVLAKYGMAQRDVEFVNLPAADGQAAFVAGRVDALVPSVNGRFSILGTRKDVREIFSYEDFTKPPGLTQPYLNYDLFVTTDAVLKTERNTLKAFLSAYHDKGVAYLLNPATHADAVKTITEYVNTEQKNPTNASIVEKIVNNSDFFDSRTTRKIMHSAEFRNSIESQVKFFSEQGQLKGALDLDKVIISDLL